VLTFAAHKLKLNFTARTLNMSTIFHSAAICKVLSLYQNSRNDYKYKLNVPDVVDKDGRSILHYSMLMPLDKDGRVRDLYQITKVEISCIMLLKVATITDLIIQLNCYLIKISVYF
jgi:hypothetical protein